jgi:hypothetical protein
MCLHVSGKSCVLSVNDPFLGKKAMEFGQMRLLHVCQRRIQKYLPSAVVIKDIIQGRLKEGDLCWNYVFAKRLLQIDDTSDRWYLLCRTIKEISGVKLGILLHRALRWSHAHFRYV